MTDNYEMFVIISVSETDISCDISLDAAFVSDDHCCSVVDTCHSVKSFSPQALCFTVVFCVTGAQFVHLLFSGRECDVSIA